MTTADFNGLMIFRGGCLADGLKFGVIDVMPAVRDMGEIWGRYGGDHLQLRHQLSHEELDRAEADDRLELGEDRLHLGVGVGVRRGRGRGR